MSFDKPRIAPSADGNGSADYRRGKGNVHPFISPEDPLPAPPKAGGRWGDPYTDTRDGLWKCALRRPLTENEIAVGLLSFLAATSPEELSEMCDREDLRARQATEDIEHWRHRNSI